MSENEKLNRNTSRKVKVEWDSRKTINTSNSGIYDEIAISS